MPDCQIQQTTKGARIVGELSFANAAQILKQSPSLAQAQYLDVSGLSSVDSAGLSVLLHWQRAATDNNIVLQLTGLSAQLRSLIDIAGLQQLLPSSDA